MSKKKSDKNVDEIKRTEEVIIFKANRPLDDVRFELLSNMVKSENKKTGLKIVLMPYSCDLVELEEAIVADSDETEDDKTADTNG